jgi:hypothetical protein
MKKIIGIVHAIAECRTCGARFEDYHNAQPLAARHAKLYGHLVEGELGMAFAYDGRIRAHWEKKPKLWKGRDAGGGR